MAAEVRARVPDTLGSGRYLDVAIDEGDDGKPFVWIRPAADDEGRPHRLTSLIAVPIAHDDMTRLDADGARSLRDFLTGYLEEMDDGRDGT